MGQVLIQEETTKNPITLIGKQAGICWNSNTVDDEKNYLRGVDCLQRKHGRTFEFPDVYMVLKDYSARVIREWYTHIGGLPTRLQASTRYIDYNNFDYVIPPSIAKDETAKSIYIQTMQIIRLGLQDLEKLNVPKEDIALMLPLGMTTTIVCKHNLRNLMDMSRQRMCGRAYWEYRQLFKDVCNALKSYSEEWRQIVDNTFYPKCIDLRGCPEKHGCGFIDKYL